MKYAHLFFCLCLLCSWPVKAEAGDALSRPPEADAPSAPDRRQTRASLPAVARCGETVRLEAAQPPLPGGTAFAGVQVSWTQRPEGREPDILPGYPASDIRFHLPGHYACTVAVGYITKGACAGAVWHERGVHRLEIDILPAPAAGDDAFRQDGPCGE